MGKMICKTLGRILAALLGAAGALALFVSVSWVSVPDSAMLPTLKPGEHVLVRKICLQDVSEGDLVYYKPEVYDAGSAGYRIRRVCSATERDVTLECEQRLVGSPDAEEVLKRDAIIGKVIGNYG